MTTVLAGPAVVLGYGVAGRSVVQFLLNQGIEVKVSEARSRAAMGQEELAELASFACALETGGHSSAFLEGCGLVLPGPGVPLNLPVLEACRQRGVPVVGELALAAGRFSVPVIAVTGANGKTTVTSLIGHLLAAAGRRPFVGGNIGTPLLTFFQQPASYGCAVLEVSSFQLDQAGEFRPDIGLLLNVTPDHLDRHGSFAAYRDAKYRLFAQQVPGDLAVIGQDDPVASQVPRIPGVRSLTFGRESSCQAQVDSDGVVLTLNSESREWYGLHTTALNSGVNRFNAAAAILVARSLGVAQQQIEQALASYRLPGHRMAEVARIGGVIYVDDSKATNIGALEAAVKGCEGPVVLIAGGRDKNSDFKLLRDVVGQRVRSLVLIGEAAPAMAAALAEVAPVHLAQSMDAAVEKAAAEAKPGDHVLLAPGCASFDMFSGYAERGEVFTAKVKELAQNKPGRGEG